MIVVFDASSLVGAALRTGGVPEIALLTVIDQGTLVVSREVVVEYRAVEGTQILVRRRNGGMFWYRHDQVFGWNV